MPAAAKLSKAFTEIKQGATEPYIQFIDRLQESLSKQIHDKETCELLLKQLALSNANDDCKQVLIPLKDPSLSDLIEACNKVGSLKHKYTEMAAAFAAMNLNAQHCFSCGRRGLF